MEFLICDTGIIVGAVDITNFNQFPLQRQVIDNGQLGQSYECALIRCPTRISHKQTWYIQVFFINKVVIIILHCALIHNANN